MNAPEKRAGDFFLSDISLDENTSFRFSPDVENECRSAIRDLLEGNYFAPLQSANGPYRLHLSMEEGRLLFAVATQDGAPHGRLFLSMTPFRRVLRDYFLLCRSYQNASEEGATAHIEAIDMGRRSIHDDGSRLLQARLAGKIDVDWETARRLFTLISALHISE